MTFQAKKANSLQVLKTGTEKDFNTTSVPRYRNGAHFLPITGNPAFFKIV